MQPAFTPFFRQQLDRLLSADLLSPLQQRHLLAWQQLSDDQLQGLAPAVVAAGKKLQNMAAIAEPALLG